MLKTFLSEFTTQSNTAWGVEMREGVRARGPGQPLPPVARDTKILFLFPFYRQGQEPNHEGHVILRRKCWGWAESSISMHSKPLVSNPRKWRHFCEPLQAHSSLEQEERSSVERPLPVNYVSLPHALPVPHHPESGALPLCPPSSRECSGLER